MSDLARHWLPRIQQFGAFSAAAFGRLAPLIDFVAVSAGQTFIVQDTADTCEYFVLEGICRSFRYSPAGDDITLSFFQGLTTLSPHSIRTSDGQARFHYAACTAALLGRIDAGAFLRLMIELPEVREFGNTVLRRELMQKVEKEIDLVSCTAHERLLRFRTRYPAFENLVPHTCIASYLGITPVSLSRLRGAHKQS